MEKKRKYNERILQVEYGSFTTSVFLVNGGVGNEVNKCYFWIAEKLAEKKRWTIFSDVLYSKKNLLSDDEINHYVHSWKSID